MKTPTRAQAQALLRRHTTGRDRLALAYTKDLRKPIAKMRVMVEDLGLPSLLAPKEHVVDASPAALVATMRGKATKMFDAVADKIADKHVREAAREGKAWVSADARDLVGIDMAKMVKASRTLTRVMKQSVTDNVELIKTIPARYFDRVEDLVQGAFDAGTRAETIAERIQELGDISERHASFIARDQMAKVTSAANQERLTTMGVDEYVWSTSQDERVRTSHEDLEGQRFRFDDPPDTSNSGPPTYNNPGFDFNCRCVALPYFAELDDNANQPKDD